MGMPRRRPFNRWVVAAACAGLLTAPGCSADESKTTSKTKAQPIAQESTATDAQSSAPSATGRFDALSISLTLSSSTVQQGKALRSRATIENNSSDWVMDPACFIAEGRYALLPVDQPDTELWVKPITDCGGPLRMPPGYRDEYQGPEFFARTKYGKPLPPGEYLAVLNIRGLTQRLEFPVTITR